MTEPTPETDTTLWGEMYATLPEALRKDTKCFGYISSAVIGVVVAGEVDHALFPRHAQFSEGRALIGSDEQAIDAINQHTEALGKLGVQGAKGPSQAKVDTLNQEITTVQSTLPHYNALLADGLPIGTGVLAAVLLCVTWSKAVKRATKEAAIIDQNMHAASTQPTSEAI